MARTGYLDAWKERKTENSAGESLRFNYEVMAKVCFTQITSTIQRNSIRGNKVLFNPWRFIRWKKNERLSKRNRFSVFRASEIKVGTKQLILVPSLVFRALIQYSLIFSTQLDASFLFKRATNWWKTNATFWILALCADSHLVLVRCCSVVMRKCDSL